VSPPTGGYGGPSTGSERHVHRTSHMAPKQPGFESSRLHCLGYPSTDGHQRRRFTTIIQLKQATVTEWDKLFHWSRHWSVASLAWLGRPAARGTNWTLDV